MAEAESGSQSQALGRVFRAKWDPELGSRSSESLNRALKNSFSEHDDFT